MDPSPEVLVNQAKQGNREALEDLIRMVRDQVYGLALRMLSQPQDAEDATQEILVKVVTHLGSFRHESAFKTWVYRVAANHLLTTHKRRAERMELTFDRLEAGIETELATEWNGARTEAEESLVVKEIMIGCMHAMLLCLDRDLRIAFILGRVFDVPGDQAADILEISPAAFRKRLSRARALMRDFMSRNCGLVNESAPCRCSKQIPFAVKSGWVDPERLKFVAHPVHARKEVEITANFSEMDEMERVTALFRSHPEYAPSERIMDNMRALLDSVKFRQH